MKLKTELELIEQERNVFQAIKYIDEVRNQNLNNYLRVLFVLLDFLVDGQYTQDHHNLISIKIKKIFNEAKLKYSSNEEFLFFAGIMAYIAEWYFDIDNIEEAKDMLELAMESSSNNIIYEWGYFTITDQRIEINTEIKFLLSNQILNDNLILEWLRNKGLLGQYVLGIIQATFEVTKSRLNH